MYVHPREPEMVRAGMKRSGEWASEGKPKAAYVQRYACGKVGKTQWFGVTGTCVLTHREDVFYVKQGGTAEDDLISSCPGRI